MRSSTFDYCVTSYAGVGVLCCERLSCEIHIKMVVTHAHFRSFIHTLIHSHCALIDLHC